MHTKIGKWGNSHGVRLSKKLLNDANISVNDDVTITAQDHKVIIEKIQKKSRVTMDSLFAGYTGDYQPTEIDWGDNKGKEIW